MSNTGAVNGDSSIQDHSSISQILFGVGQLQTLVAVIDTKLTDALKDVSDHEIRIRALERFRFTIAGAGAAGGGLIGWLASYLQNLHH